MDTTNFNIPNILSNLNFATIPQIIINEFNKVGEYVEIVKFNNQKNELIINIDNGNLAFDENAELLFYCTKNNFNKLKEKLESKEYIFFDKNDINPFIMEYKKGFTKGYYDFENSLKINNSPFNVTNEIIAHNIFRRVYNTSNKNGYFIPFAENENLKEHSLYMDLANFYDGGICGGEFFKAWELILNNPTVFEPIFKASIKIETIPEPEPLDLSNTSAVEKIIYLNELGIIDFLRSKPEFISVNLLATFLSSITGEKPLTLQTSLNRLLTNDTADKNHPYQTKKTVNKVRQTLIDKNIKPRTSLD
jgi:hypothetical protein